MQSGAPAAYSCHAYCARFRTLLRCTSDACATLRCVIPYYLVFSLSIDLLAYTNADICHREYLARLSLIPVRLFSPFALTMDAIMLISMCRRIPVLLSPLPPPFVQFMESRSRYELDSCVGSTAVPFSCVEHAMCCRRATLEVRLREKIASICYRDSS